MNTLTTILTSTSLLIAAACTAPNANACAPTLATMRTNFPAEAVEKKQSGVVHLGILIDEQGAVVAARIIASSGHATLDRSAMNDVRRHWHFQIGQCTASELAEEREVLVTYRRPVGTTVSGTLNRTALARIREFEADQYCHATQGSNDMTVFACREGMKERQAAAVQNK